MLCPIFYCGQSPLCCLRAVLFSATFHQRPFVALFFLETSLWIISDYLSFWVKPFPDSSVNPPLALSHGWGGKRRVENVTPYLSVTPQMACDRQLSLTPCLLIRVLASWAGVERWRRWSGTGKWSSVKKKKREGGEPVDGNSKGGVGWKVKLTQKSFILNLGKVWEVGIREEEHGRWSASTCRLMNKYQTNARQKAGWGVALAAVVRLNLDSEPAHVPSWATSISRKQIASPYIDSPGASNVDVCQRQLMRLDLGLANTVQHLSGNAAK